MPLLILEPAVLRLHGVLVLLVSIVFLGWGAAGGATPQRAAFKVKLTHRDVTKDWTSAAP